jgi:hypothetical protein
MNKEHLSEKWYKFIRFHCKEGYIDVWSGDSYNDPNNDEKGYFNLNTTSYYVRLNDGIWLSEYENFKRGFHLELIELHQEFTAQEIWNSYEVKR